MEQSIRMDEINVRVILKDLLRSSVLILMAVLTVLMGVRIYRNLVYVPEYTSHATMAILAKGNADGNAYSSLTTASSMAEVFAEVFQSSIIEEKVEEVLGGMPAGTKISSKLIPETNLLELYVKSRNPQASYRVIQVILENYRYVSDYLFGNAILELIQAPEVPVYPSNRFDTSRMDKLGCLAAVVLMTGLIVLFTILRGTVKTVKAGKRNLEGECIATIPYEDKNHTLKGKIVKKNKAILLNVQVVSFEYEESFHHLASELEYKMDQAKKKILLVTSVAENEGKSTACMNLAAALAQRGKRVLVIDMDFQKPALHKLTEMKIAKKEQLLEYLQGNTTLENLLQYDKRLDIYTMLNDQSVADVQPYLNSKRFVQMLLGVRKVFDYVILDCAPVSAGSDVEYLENYAEASMLVVRQDVVRISDLNDTIEMLKEGRAMFTGCVLNAFDRSARAAGKGGYGYGYGYGKYGSYGRYGRYAQPGQEIRKETEETR